MHASEPVDSLTDRIIGCAIEVHRELGPGLLESIYRNSLEIELSDQGLKVDKNKPIDLRYRGREIGPALILDLQVENRSS